MGWGIYPRGKWRILFCGSGLGMGTGGEYSSVIIAWVWLACIRLYYFFLIWEILGHLFSHERAFTFVTVVRERSLFELMDTGWLRSDLRLAF